MYLLCTIFYRSSDLASIKSLKTLSTQPVDWAGLMKWIDYLSWRYLFVKSLAMNKIAVFLVVLRVGVWLLTLGDPIEVPVHLSMIWTLLSLYSDSDMKPFCDQPGSLVIE